MELPYLYGHTVLLPVWEDRCLTMRIVMDEVHLIQFREMAVMQSYRIPLGRLLIGPSPWRLSTSKDMREFIERDRPVLVADQILEDRSTIWILYAINCVCRDDGAGVFHEISSFPLEK